jgi:hypothetical protein
MSMILAASVAFSSVDMLLGSYILFVQFPRTVAAIREAQKQYIFPRSGAVFTVAIYATFIASTGQVLLNAAYLYYLAVGGTDQLPFQFPNNTEFAVVSTATALRELAGAVSRLFYTIGVRLVLQWLVEESTTESL